MFRSAPLLVTSVTLALQLVTVAGCNGQLAPDVSLATSDVDAGATGSSTQGAGTGTIATQVELPAGVLVSTLAYTLDGPWLQRNGDGLVRRVRGARVRARERRPGQVQLDVTAFLADGSGTCTASASLVVLAGVTTHVVLGAACTGVAALSDPATPPTSMPAASGSAAPSMPPPGTPLGSVSVSATLPAGSSFSTVGCELTGPEGSTFATR